MPSRLLREGILDSEGVNSLSPGAEVFYRRLMSVVDDYGRFDGRVSVLRSRLYPLQLDRVRESDLPRYIAECEKAGLVRLYAVDGKPYILFHKLGPARAKESKYPPPPKTPPVETAQAANTHPFTDVNGCKQTHTDAPYSYSGSGAYSGSGSGAKYCPEPAEPASGPHHQTPTPDPPEPAPPDPEPPVLVFPVVGTGPKEWPLTAAKLAEYQSTFPGVDVLAECRKARQWVVDTPSRRKTTAGMPRFLSGWLGRAQDRGPPARASPVAQPAAPPPGDTRSRVERMVDESKARIAARDAQWTAATGTRPG